MTEEERYEKLNDKLDRILDKLENKLQSVDEKLSNHEVRIVILETHDKADKNDWKGQIIGLLVKAVVIGAVAVASLAGAGGIVAKIFGA